MDAADDGVWDQGRLLQNHRLAIEAPDPDGFRMLGFDELLR